MKKYFIFLILLSIIACNSKWEDKSFTNENGNRIASYKKNIKNLELTYNFNDNETNKSELLNIKDNLYIYSIAKLVYDERTTFHFAKGKADYKDANDLIDITDNEFIDEVKSLKIREELIKQNDEITKKVIYLLDEIL